jgi:hypothetical protein
VSLFGLHAFERQWHRAADLPLRLKPAHDLDQSLGYGTVSRRLASRVRWRDRGSDRVTQASQRSHERGIVTQFVN